MEAQCSVFGLNVVNMFFVFFSVQRWSETERAAVQKELGYLITIQRAPRKTERLNAIAASAPALQYRDWRSVKNHVASKIRYARRAQMK